MSKQKSYIGKKPRQQTDKTINVILVIVLTALGLFVLGCAPGWQTYRLYDGTERPLKEVAIVSVPPQVYLTVDNKSPQRSEGPAEYHLEPGLHEFVASYLFGGIDYTMSGDPISFSKELEPGYVYDLYAIVNTQRVNAAGYEKGLWGCKVQRFTFESYSAKLALNIIACEDSHITVSIPQHWIDMLKNSLRTFSVGESICLWTAKPFLVEAKDYIFFVEAPDYSKLNESVRNLNMSSTQEWNAPGSRELSEGYYEQAIQMFSDSLQSSKESDRVRINRGVAYERTGRLQDALEDFSQVPDKSPHRSLALLNRAVVKYRMGNIQGARDDIQIAQQSNPASGIEKALQWANRILSIPGN